MANGTILIVNDMPGMLELMSIQFHQAGYQILTATNGREGFEIARRLYPDMVVSDVAMPEVNGIELCRLIRAEDGLRTIPILLVSALRKDTADVVAGLEAGADDYLEAPYDPLRLIAKVARLLERRQAEVPLKFQAHLLNTVEQAVIATDLEGKISYWNRFAEKLYGWSAAEAIGGNILDIIPAQGMLEQASEIMSRLKEGGSWLGEFVVQRKDGTTFPASVTDSPIYDDKGSLVGVVGVSFDITERKRAEDALRRANDELERRVEQRTSELTTANVLLEEKIAECTWAEQTLRENHNLLQGVIEGTTDCIFVKELNGRYLMVNSASASFIGKSAEEIVGKDDTELFPPEIAQQLIAADHQVYASEGVLTLDETLLYEGLPRTALVTKNVYRNDKGEAIGLIGIARDITERKQAEEKIKESERQLAVAQQIAHLGSWEWEISANKVSLSDELYRILGLTPQPFGASYDNYLEQVHPNDRELSNRIIKKALGDHKPFDFEHRIVRPDGEVRTLRCRGEIVTDESGHAVRMYGISEDITERRWAEEALRESEERFRMFSEESSEGIVIHSDGLILDANKTAAKMCGYEPSEVLGMSVLDFVAPESHDLIRKNTLAKYEGIYEAVGLRKDGTKFPGAINGKTFNYKGQESRLTLFRDITERKRAEEVLRHAEEKYHGIFENAVEGIYQSTPDGRFITINPAMARMCGYASPGEMVAERTDIERQHYVNPQRRAEFKRLIVQNDIVQHFESEVFRKDGSILWTSENVRAVRDTDGTLLYYEGMIEDITERKRAVEALRESEELQRLMVEGIKDYAIFMIDTNGYIASWNEGATRLKGYHADEVIGQYLSICCTPEDIAQGKPEQALKIATTEGRFEYECWLIRKDGSRFWADIIITALRNEAGVLRGFTEINRDITERRRAEEALKQSEQDYRALFEQAHDAIVVFAPEREIVLDVNKRACEIYGFSQSEFIGMSLETISKDVARGKVQLAETLERGEYLNFETEQYRKDGTEMLLEINASTVLYRGQRVILSINRDITERKRTQVALRKSEERYRAFINQSSEAIWRFELELPIPITLSADEQIEFCFKYGYLAECNTAMARMYGYSSPEEIMGARLGDLVVRSEPQNIEFLRNAIRMGYQLIDVESREVDRDGRPKWFLNNLVGIMEDGYVVRVWGTQRDITDHKRAEDELKDSEESYRRLVELLTDAIVVVSEGKIDYINSAGMELFGATSLEQIIGLPIFDLIHPSFHELVKGRIGQTLEGKRTSLMEQKHVRLDGQIINTEVSGVGFTYRGKQATQSVIRDITERVRAKEARIQLQLRLLVAQEEERRRLSRELHDQMGQHLPALILGLKAQKDAGQISVDHLQQLQDLAERIARDTHQLARDLRPAALDDFGLVIALSNYLEEWSQRYKLLADFQSIGFNDEERFSVQVETTLYRTVQEALTNVVKHAEAEHVSLILKQSPEALLAVIEDDGKGFEVEAVMDTPIAERRLGLLGMQERVELVGGTLEIESAPGAGTTVAIRIPIITS
jgi:PAS domain S-box-containing protein